MGAALGRVGGPGRGSGGGTGGGGGWHWKEWGLILHVRATQACSEGCESVSHAAGSQLVPEVNRAPSSVTFCRGAVNKDFYYTSLSVSLLCTSLSWTIFKHLNSTMVFCH